MSALVADISDAADAAVAELALDREIPLLGVGKMIRVGGTVIRSVGAVIGGCG